MKRALFSILLVVACLTAEAQLQRGIKGSYNLDEFPKVSFVWNTANPELIGKSGFALYEEGTAIDFTCTSLPVDKSQSVEKSILFLWEDMASHSRQSDFTRELLTRFFRETSLATTDCFEVAAFDRQKDTERNVLHPLIGVFSSDATRLASAVEAYRKNVRTYSSFSQQSDLYQAINEGIAMLKKEPADRSGVIVVVTAGLNVKASGASTEMETVRKNALEAGIPVYVVKYPLSGNTPEVNVLAESTYGLSSSTTSVATALGNMQQQYYGMDNRLRGHDYKFTFTSQAKQGDGSHAMRLTVDKVSRPLPPYTPPKESIWQWSVSHWWLTLPLALLLIGGIVLAIVLTKKRKRATLAMQEQMRREQEESERRSQEAVESMRREQEAKERAAREAALRSEMAAEEERLERLMQTKNLFPRLQCKAGTESFSYTIGKPCVTLGRDADNDVAFTLKNASFNNQTVSGHHAEIVFNGSAFEVVNKSRTYKQGIIVNGQFYQRYTLRSGDMIGLGDAIITFYV